MLLAAGRGVSYTLASLLSLKRYSSTAIRQRKGRSEPVIDVQMQLTLFATQFAIRTTIRNHAVLTRDIVIKLVADAVGSPHTVDLSNYELLILVEVYKVCTLSSPRHQLSLLSAERHIWVGRRTGHSKVEAVEVGVYLLPC